MNAAAIASGIDTSTVAGHNLRALLLRLADGDRIRDRDNVDVAACVMAEPLGLVETRLAVRLTPLGREVAERLRPVPWSVAKHQADVELVRPDGTVRSFGDPGPSINAWTRLYDEAERIAALLTADDLRAAKTYRVES
jgi:hypothetical protein